MSVRRGDPGAVPGDRRPDAHQQKVGQQRAGGEGRGAGRRHRQSHGQQAAVPRRRGQV